jgi:hypothetical protein
MTASIPSETPIGHVPNSPADWVQIPNTFQAHRMAPQNPRHHLHQQHQQCRVQWNRYGRCVRPAINWVNRVSQFWSMHAVGCSVGASPIPGFTQVPSLLLPRNAYVRSHTGIGSSINFTTHSATERQWIELVVEASFVCDRPRAQPMMELQ